MITNFADGLKSPVSRSPQLHGRHTGPGRSERKPRAAATFSPMRPTGNCRPAISRQLPPNANAGNAPSGVRPKAGNHGDHRERIFHSRTGANRTKRPSSPGATCRIFESRRSCDIPAVRGLRLTLLISIHPPTLSARAKQAARASLATPAAHSPSSPQDHKHRGQFPTTE